MASIESMIVFTHRGLEPSKPDFFPESSFEAFEDQLSRGFGIEFDPNFCKDGIVVWHDPTLERFSLGKDLRALHDLTVEELHGMKSWNTSHTAEGKIPTFDEVMDLIRKSESTTNALHFKGKYQTPDDLQTLIEHLKKNSDVLSRILIFDVKPETAKTLLEAFPEIALAPSVAHQHDVDRFNSVVAETLIETDEVVQMLKDGIFGKNPWVWLDEWDLTGENGGTKKLYTAEVFNKMRAAGAKIALVTPELHGTSPHLLGDEAHPDAPKGDTKTLFKRIKEIIDLNPDGICTDYPEEAKELN
ncbi:hypothetical protein A3F00_02870 [Candidatus Daviesbacteria bacterium RIFCSPHIGHO2_12_FULL_37_11]|uniref:GP-PDE domain-containing protein n=1 Tax=Candidatus Daviesbacteria bacterium RIFCSPHIGHO2_12_FULL_37_11 TaxID=1797777 RepID=A0A1F5KBA9_9BACT|nr:MAG: hypothetical protein A2769_04160 [Candidatus Daviesbacteria bacterium RIFCSPHIGHO2_01_FULL_37_27]OGE38243.1 MAG: hypothetical protein A3F00_02870 [Candidatus Daviesbacteria bacterium RIFCSPHIGHO2_12_FULL_37_11]OGE46200.1 MAG: hypothetical protein A3B39_02635 [Candidatus Daviesbacteria bacterium RIFCSPLOWO2_01_FULL_37_10]